MIAADLEARFLRGPVQGEPPLDLQEHA
jgi:hypothetical protein